jgi:dTDP-4-dehydrorhamnose reductase
MLGHKLVQRLSARFAVSATIRGAALPASPAGDLTFAKASLVPNIDVHCPGDIERALELTGPDVVINAIGVVKQLAEANDPLTAIGINALLPHRIAAACRARQPSPRFLHFSTDCVFSGRRGPYAETEHPEPDDLYGRTKLLGEVEGPGCLTIRSSIVGRELRGFHGLIEWVMSQRGRRVNGFTGALYTGLTTIEMTDLMGRLVADHPDLEGIWHVASDPISKHDLLQIINRQFELGIDIRADDNFQCDRRLDGRRFAAVTGYQPPSWEEMIMAMRDDPTPYDSGL